jgi:ribosomal 50S subunit-recycling heat shock protein
VNDAVKGLLIPHRVQFTYTGTGDSKHLLSIKTQATKSAGTVTGLVVKNYGWWIEVKPKSGLSDGYALNFGEKNKDILAKFKEMNEGDSVTVTFSTDFERHRIKSLHKNPTPVHKTDSPSLAEGDSSKHEHKAAGILIDRKNDWITVKVDGEDELTKYVVEPENKKLNDAFKTVFNACRVQLTFVNEGEIRQLASIKRQIIKPAGTVTGEVVKVYNDFWVEVKPKSGVSDAYAPGANYNDKEFMAKLKGLKPGDMVTITFTTDFERHRITTLQKHAASQSKSSGSLQSPSKE